MMWLALLFPALLLLDGATNAAAESNNNMCSRIDKFRETHTIPYTYTFQEKSTHWCLQVPPRCTKYKTRTAMANKTITVFKTKTIFECCSGYVKRNGACVPVCEGGCGHGMCLKPGICACDEGWRNPQCSIDCEPNRYGSGCIKNCSCQNGASCDRRNGTCYCLPGFYGLFCERHCPEDTYGFDCKNHCKCQNGGMCDIKDGTCDCQPGYIGDYCQEKCLVGYHGLNCEETCKCVPLRTESCNHVDGNCTCVPGWKGKLCDEMCDPFTWGANCSKECECDHNATCDHISGECICTSGWTGKKCSKKCPLGSFGSDCKYDCQYCKNETGSCHHVTGWCNCPAGKTGERCELECPDGFWGNHCEEICNCSANSTCDRVRGNCVCLPGWVGDDCSMPAPNSFQQSIFYTYSPLGLAMGLVLCLVVFICGGIFYCKCKAKKLKTSMNSLSSRVSSSCIPNGEANISVQAARFMNPSYGNSISTGDNIESSRDASHSNNCDEDFFDPLAFLFESSQLESDQRRESSAQGKWPIIESNIYGNEFENARDFNPFAETTFGTDGEFERGSHVYASIREPQNVSNGALSTFKETGDKVPEGSASSQVYDDVEIFKEDKDPAEVTEEEKTQENVKI